MIKIFGVCYSVFPRRTLSQPRGCFSLLVHRSFYIPTNFLKPDLCGLSVVLVSLFLYLTRAHTHSQIHKRTHAIRERYTRTARCDRIFICQFSCCVYIVFKLCSSSATTISIFFFFSRCACVFLPFAHLYKYIRM